jgi:hypothetical protein
MKPLSVKNLVISRVLALFYFTEYHTTSFGFVNVIGNFESALILLIDERIDVPYHNKVFRNHQNEMVEDVEQIIQNSFRHM